MRRRESSGLQAISRALADQGFDSEATEATVAETEKIEALLEAPFKFTGKNCSVRRTVRVAT